MKKITCLAVCFALLFVIYLHAADVPFVELKHSSAVKTAVFSPDAKKVFTASSTGFMEGAIIIWDTESGRRLHSLKNGDSADFIAISPNGKQMLTTADDRILIREVDPPKYLGDWESVFGRSIAYSPDGKKIAVGSNRYSGSLKIWDAESNKMSKLDEHNTGINSVAFSPDGKKIVTGNSDKTARIWDAESRRVLRKLEGHDDSVNSAAFSPDGKRIVTGSRDKTARIWDAESGRVLRKLEGHDDSVNTVAFSPDGKKIAISSGYTAHIWDTESGMELRKLEGHDNAVNSVAFSPDGTKIVTASRDMTARIWNWSLIERQLVDAQKRREAEGTFDLNEERQKSGFSQMNDFLQFGSSALKDKMANAEKSHQQADAFDRADAQAKVNAVQEEIKTALTEIARKKFYDEFTYSVPPHIVQVDGDRSSFAMEIPAEFTSSKIEEVLFPMPGVTGQPGSGGQGLVLSVSGSTGSIRELVRESGNYRARVWFTNLRAERGGWGGGTTSADVLKIEIIKVQ